LPGKKERGFVIGGKKWVYFDNLKRRKTICDPGQPSTTMSKRNIYGKMAVLCIWWDQKSVYYEILKLGQIVTGDLYQQQMIRLSRALREKRPGYEIRQHKVILLHNNLTSRH